MQPGCHGGHGVLLTGFHDGLQYMDLSHAQAVDTPAVQGLLLNTQDVVEQMHQHLIDTCTVFAHVDSYGIYFEIQSN